MPDHALGAKLFIPVWAMMALANMWGGVARAGYPLRDELPMLGLVFAVPAMVAGLALWWLAR